MKIILSISIFLLIGLSISGQATPELYYEQSIEKLNTKDVDGALKDIEKSLELDSTFVDSYYLRGYIYHQLGKLGLALNDYDKLIQLDPQHLGGLLNRAALKLNTGDIEGAIKDHTTRISLDTENETFYFDRAYCKGLEGDYQGAIEDYAISIKLNPQYKEAYANSGFTKINMLTTQGIIQPTQEQTENACIDLRKAEELGDNTVEDMIFIYCSKKSKKKNKKKAKGKKKD